jgi:hypothetical protein
VSGKFGTNGNCNHFSSFYLEAKMALILDERIPNFSLEPMEIVIIFPLFIYRLEIALTMDKRVPDFIWNQWEL